MLACEAATFCDTIPCNIPAACPIAAFSLPLCHCLIAVSIPPKITVDTAAPTSAAGIPTPVAPTAPDPTVPATLAAFATFNAVPIFHTLPARASAAS
jgi:hypothetical protein